MYCLVIYLFLLSNTLLNKEYIHVYCLFTNTSILVHTHVQVNTYIYIYINDLITIMQY